MLLILHLIYIVQTKSCHLNSVYAYIQQALVYGTNRTALMLKAYVWNFKGLDVLCNLAKYTLLK